MKTILGSSLIVLLLYSHFGVPGRSEAASVLLERVGPYGGDVRSLLIDYHNPDIVWLGTGDGQIYKSVNRGASWKPLFPGIGQRQLVVDTLVQHPTEPERLYAGAWDIRSSGGGLFASSDGGFTWKRMTLPQPSLAVRDLSICRSRTSHMIVGTQDGVYVTKDAGVSWRQVTNNSAPFKNVASVAIDPVNPAILFVGTWRLGYRSTDSGRTWIRVNQGMLFDSHVFTLSIDPRDPQVIFASACSGIYRSANRASTWTRLKILPDRYGVRAQTVYIDPVDSKRIYGGTTEGLFVSQNSGLTWQRITSKRAIINAIQVDSRDSKRILIGTNDEGVLRSEDGGRTWQASNFGFVHRQISRIIPDPEAEGRFFTGLLSDGHAGGFFLYDNHRDRWTPLTSEITPAGLEVLSFLSLPGRQGKLAGTARGVYQQQSTSTAWVRLRGEIESLVVNDLAVDSENSWIFAATSDGVYRATLAELDFQKPLSSFRPEVFSVVVSPKKPPTAYAGTNYGVLRSRNQGKSWELASAGLPYRVIVECIAVCPAHAGHIFAGTAVGLFESDDGAASWRKTDDGRLGVDVPSVIFLEPTGQKVMAADKTFGGVFLSENGGKTWEKINAPDFGSPVRYLAQDPARPHLVYLGTNSEGVYRLRLQ